jgi:predicted transcriptional regulator
MIESKYLKQTDVEEDRLVTIAKVGKANVAREGDEPEYKWLIRFQEFNKPMVLNSTNIKRLAKACASEETDEWIGKQVVLYVDPDVEFAGNVVGGLRVRAHKQAPQTRQVMPKQTGGHFDDMADDVPF